jgi:hypothetical protein
VTAATVAPITDRNVIITGAAILQKADYNVVEKKRLTKTARTASY